MTRYLLNLLVNLSFALKVKKKLSVKPETAPAQNPVADENKIDTLNNNKIYIVSMLIEVFIAPAIQNLTKFNQLLLSPSYRIIFGKSIGKNFFSTINIS